MLGEGWHEGENWNDGLMHWAEGDSFAPPLPSDAEDMAICLRSAGSLSEKDTFVDLGCGDGRLCLAAAAYFGCRAIGVEIEQEFADKSRKAAEELKLDQLVTVVCGDVLEFELCATIHSVVVLYLLPEALKALLDKLVAFIEAGGCVISSTWGLPGIEPTEEHEIGCFKVSVYRGPKAAGDGEEQEQEQGEEGGGEQELGGEGGLSG